MAKTNDVADTSPGITANRKTGQPGMVDVTGAMQRLGNDRDLFNEFVIIFLEDAPELILNIEEAIERREARTIEKNAHSLKGLISNFGATECVKAAHQVELVGRSRNLATVFQDFLKLKMLVAELTKELKRLG